MRSSDSGYAHGTTGSPQTSIEQEEYTFKVAENEAALKEFADSLSGETMPNRELAKTSLDKFTKYSLDPNNPKASGKPEAYRRGLGYTKENAVELRDKIHAAVTSGSICPYEIETSNYGAKYKYRIPITGPNGKTKNVIAVYQIDSGADEPRLITNYLEGR